MPAHQRVSNEQVITAYREKGSVWKAAMSLGICGQSVHERLQRLGVKLCGAPWSEEEIEVATQLSVDGWPIARIAEHLGRPYAGVACKLSEVKVRSPYKAARKIPRGTGLTKSKVGAFARYLLKSGMSVNKAARQKHMSTSSLVWALQRYTPEIWAEYLSKHAHLPAKECPGCGNSFIPLTKKQKACTSRCSGHARADVKYFGGKRRNTLGLAEGVCQLCEQKGKTLSSHHVFGKENDPQNETLIALCMGCHQLVGILGRRKDATMPEFWENLIALAVARAWADKGRKAAGTFISVDIEELSAEETEECADGGRGTGENETQEADNDDQAFDGLPA